VPKDLNPWYGCFFSVTFFYGNSKNNDNHKEHEGDEVSHAYSEGWDKVIPVGHPGKAGATKE
jgi:hypothetical protein